MAKNDDFFKYEKYSHSVICFEIRVNRWNNTNQMHSLITLQNTQKAFFPWGSEKNRDVKVWVFKKIMACFVLTS